MEGIIIALIGAFATIATAFISKSSNNPQDTGSPQTNKKNKDNQYKSINKEVNLREQPIHSSSLTWRKVFLRLIGILLCLSALLCFFGAIVNLSVAWGTVVGFAIIGIACGLVGWWLYKIS